MYKVYTGYKENSAGYKVQHRVWGTMYNMQYAAQGIRYNTR
jgi:hypothetical protein